MREIASSRKPLLLLLFHLLHLHRRHWRLPRRRLRCRPPWLVGVCSLANLPIKNMLTTTQQCHWHVATYLVDSGHHGAPTLIVAAHNNHPVCWLIDVYTTPLLRNLGYLEHHSPSPDTHPILVGTPLHATKLQRVTNSFGSWSMCSGWSTRMPALKGVNPTEKRQIVERRKVSSSNLNGGRILQKNLQDVGIHIVIISMSRI